MSSPFSIQCGSLVLLLPVTACLRAAPTTRRAGRPSRVGRSDRPRPPSSIERRLGARIQPFGACSGFTRVAAVRSLTRSKRISVPEASTGRSPSLSLGSYQGIATPPWTGLVRAETLSPAVRHLRIARVEKGRPLCESMSVSLSLIPLGRQPPELSRRTKEERRPRATDWRQESQPPGTIRTTMERGGAQRRQADDGDGGDRLSWIRPPGGRSDGAGHRLRESR